MGALRAISLAACCAALSVAAVPLEKGSGGGNSSDGERWDKAAYDAVVKRLDTGGVYFFYQSKKRANKRLERNLDCLEKLMEDVFAGENNPSPGYRSARRIFRCLRSRVETSGITDVSGVGMSSIALGDGRYGNRVFIHHFPKDSKGALWKVFKRGGNALDTAAIIPGDAQIAGACELDLKAIAEWLAPARKEISEAFGDLLSKANPAKDKTAADSKKSEFDTGRFVEGLDGRFLFFITCDCENSTRKTFFNLCVEIPRMEFLAAAGVPESAKGKALGEIEKLLAPNVKRVRGEDGVERLLFDASDPRSMFAPLIEEVDGMLVFASNEKVLEKFLATRSGKDGNIRGTTDFKTIAAGMPERCGAFFYVSPKLAPALGALISRDADAFVSKQWGAGTTKDEGAPKGAEAAAIEKRRRIVSDVLELVENNAPFDGKSCVFATIETKDDGIMLCSTAGAPFGEGGAGAFLASGIYSRGELTAYAMSALLSKAEDDEPRGVKNNMRALADALNAYALDHGGRYPKGNGARGFSELAEGGYLVDLSVLGRPEKNKKKGGKYAKRVFRLPLTEDMCDYAYIGGLIDKAPRNLPLLFEKPTRATGVRVLLAGGRIIRTRKKISTCRQLMSSLAREFNYPAKLAASLLERGVRYDKLLGLGVAGAKRRSPSRTR